MNKLISWILCLMLALLCITGAVCEEQAYLTSADSVRQDVTGSFPSARLEDDEVLVQESDNLRLWANPEQKLFKVEDKRNGYVFASARKDEQAQSLTKKWQNFAASPVMGEFVTISNLNTFTEAPDFDSMEFILLEDGVRWEMDFVKAGISLVMEAHLDGDSLLVEIPDAGIVSHAQESALLRLSVLPFMGAAFVGEGSGYVFVPDGSGALVRFDSPASSRPLTLRAYGQDYSLLAVGNNLSGLSSLPTKDTQHALMPVYGIAHGAQGSAFVVWPEEGDEYSAVMCSPAGNANLKCYWACFQSVYKELYQQPISNTDAFTVLQGTANTVNLKLRYTFLSGENASYVGMALTYRDYLEQTQNFSSQSSKGDIPMLLDCLMADSVKSLIGTRLQQMTTLENVDAWISYLREEGVENLVLSLEGTGKGGDSRTDYDDAALNRALGDASLLETWQEQGLQVLINRRFLRFFEAQLPDNSRGYAITQRFVTSQESSYLDQTAYYLRLDDLEQLARKLTKPWANIASDDLGQYLYGGYRNNAKMTRSESMSVLEQVLESMTAQGTLALAQPGAYALPYTDLAYDLPWSHSSMIFETDAVPFVQIVLSGKIAGFTTSQVAGGDSTQTILRMIDFNLYPHYTLTEGNASLLAKSNSSELFATCAEDLLPLVAEEYEAINSVLKEVTGEKIVGRQVPADGLSIVSYESGTRIVINYNESEVTHEGRSIPALTAQVWKEPTGK